MRKLRGRLLIVFALLAILAGCHPLQDIGCRPIPSILKEPAELSTRTQSFPFSFGPSGTHELYYYMKLRHGAGSSNAAYMLRGDVSVHAADGRISFSKTFLNEVGPNQVGGTIASLPRNAAAGRDPHTLTLTFREPPAGFLAAYTDLTIYLKRHPLIFLCGY